jgi:hypothetical protein
MQKMFRLTVTLTAIVMLVACSDSTDEGNNNNNNNNADTTSSMDSGTTLIQPDTSNVVDTNTTTQTPLQQCQGAVNCLQTCVQSSNCAPTDQTCMQGCQDSCSASNADGWAIYMEIETCLAGVCSNITSQEEMQVCALAEQASGGACFQQASACGLQGGSGNCNSVVTCVFACAEGDTNCQGQCFSNGSKDGINDFFGWNNCLNTACNQYPQGSPESADCIQAAQKQGGACFAQTDTCGMATGTGSGSCKDTFICLVLCDENDSACPLGCQQKASQEGLDGFLAINDCLGTACAGVPAGPQAQDCYGAAQVEGGACFADYQACGLYGSGPCGAIDPCFANCTEYECIYNCLFEASAPAQSLFNDWQGCLQDACYQPGQPCNVNPQGPECGNCQGNNCQTEKAACDAQGGAGPAPSPFMQSFDPEAGSPKDFSRAFKNARIYLNRTPFKFFNSYN